MEPQVLEAFFLYYCEIRRRLMFCCFSWMLCNHSGERDSTFLQSRQIRFPQTLQQLPEPNSIGVKWEAALSSETSKLKRFINLHGVKTHKTSVWKSPCENLKTYAETLRYKVNAFVPIHYQEEIMYKLWKWWMVWIGTVLSCFLAKGVSTENLDRLLECFQLATFKCV